jgi:hypothetical protein
LISAAVFGKKEEAISWLAIHLYIPIFFFSKAYGVGRMARLDWANVIRAKGWG